ncbi:MAG: prepilin peptidase [Candidatus Peregrinibacteria bacterium]|nr:prepilin peptidase [Candidatus Peregrinibacteria bacterium]
MQLLVSAIIFILGSAIGSFISVVIYRLQAKKKGIIAGHSMCPSCKKQLKWKHLIPIFSWLFLRGKCAYCNKKISVHYLLLEVLTGTLFLVSFIHWNFLISIPSIINPQFLNYSIDWNIFATLAFYLVEFSFLMAIFFFDLMHKEIPDQLSIPAIVIAIAGILSFSPVMQTGINMLIGGGIIFLFFFLQYILSRGTWIGGGDLRLGALMGILLSWSTGGFSGWLVGILGLVIAYLIGGLLSVILIIAKKLNHKSTIPFGPFLVIGTVTAIFFGQTILNWYFNTLLM